MQSALPHAWAWWSAAIAVGVLGVLLLLWALFRDRSRGRRRCPRCWYDMSATTGSTCPECGRDARHERRLFRTRRRWKWALVALVLITSAAALSIAPFAASPTWWTYAPTPVLIARALDRPTTNTHAMEGELRKRLQNNQIHGWEKRWLAARASRALQLPSTQSPAERALRFLIGIGPEGVAAAPSVMPLLDDQDITINILSWTALTRVGMRDPAAVARLNAMLTDPSTVNMIRQRVTNRLADNGPESAPCTSAIIQIIQRLDLHAVSDGYIKGGAAMTLGSIGPAASEALPTLRALAGDEGEPLQRRYAANMAIAQITQDVSDPLRYHVRMLRDPDVGWRRQAADYLHSHEFAVDGKEAIVPLLRALNDPDAIVGANARSALAMMIGNDPRATVNLKAIEQGSDPALAALARDTLARGGQSGAVGFAAPPPAAPGQPLPGAK